MSLQPRSLVRCRSGVPPCRSAGPAAVADPPNIELARLAPRANDRPPVLERWFEIIASGGSGDVEELLADDAVFYSPAVFTPQRGRAQAAAYLRAAEKLFAGANFRYVGKWFDAHSAVLEFAAEIDGSPSRAST